MNTVLLFLLLSRSCAECKLRFTGDFGCTSMYVCMNGWLYDCMNGWLYGWKDGRMNGIVVFTDDICLCIKFYLKIYLFSFFSFEKIIFWCTNWFCDTTKEIMNIGSGTYRYLHSLFSLLYIIQRDSVAWPYIMNTHTLGSSNNTVCTYLY